MALFQLAPASIVARVRNSGQPASIPTLNSSILRGILGFTIVSVAGFAPCPLVDRFVAWGATKVFVGPELRLRGPRNVVIPLIHHDDHLHVDFE